MGGFFFKKTNLEWKISFEIHYILKFWINQFFSLLILKDKLS